MGTPTGRRSHSLGTTYLEALVSSTSARLHSQLIEPGILQRRLPTPSFAEKCGPMCPESPPFAVESPGNKEHVAVGQNQLYHFGVGAPSMLVYFSGDWDVHWGVRAFDPWPCPAVIDSLRNQPVKIQNRSICLGPIQEISFFCIVVVQPLVIPGK